MGRDSGEPRWWAGPLVLGRAVLWSGGGGRFGHVGGEEEVRWKESHRQEWGGLKEKRGLGWRSRSVWGGRRVPRATPRDTTQKTAAAQQAAKKFLLSSLSRDFSDLGTEREEEDEY